MKSTILEGLCTWSVWQPDRRIDFNGFYWSRPHAQRAAKNGAAGGAERGGLFIDPMPLSADQIAFAREQGGARWTLVTNADHLRAAREVREAFGAEVLAPSADRERFGEHQGQVDRWFESAHDLPEPLRADIEVFGIRGGKSPVEIALHLKPIQALFFGDIVRSHVCGRLMLLPDAKLADKLCVVSDLAALAELPVQALLLGDGDSFYVDGGTHFARFVAGLR